MKSGENWANLAGTSETHTIKKKRKTEDYQVSNDSKIEYLAAFFTLSCQQIRIEITIFDNVENYHRTF